MRDAADQFDDARLLLDAQPAGSGVLLPLMNSAAVALELYLKSLGAVTIHTPTPGFPRFSKVTARARTKGHDLVGRLKAIPNDVRQSLEREYEVECPGRVLQDDLQTYEGLFAASRFPFEKDHDIRHYPLHPLMELCSYLRNFVATM